MQNSELYRRGVVLPLTARAEELLRSGDVDEDVGVRYLEIADDDLFYRLSELGVFAEINQRASTLLDDYEEDFLDNSVVGVVADVIESVSQQHAGLSNDVRAFLGRLAALATDAQASGRSLLFVL